MKKGLKYYIPCWAVLLAVFNIITFAVPVTVNVNKFSPSFWIGYGFVTLAFIAQLVCSLIFFKQDTKEKRFLNIPVISLSYTALLLSIIIGAVAMAVPSIPYWIAVIVDVLITAFYAIAIISSKAAADTVSSIDTKIKQQTFFIKSLSVYAQSLVNSAKTDEMKTLANKVYEAVRYSDPMSSPQLETIENEIEIKFNQFLSAVKSDNASLAQSIADELVTLIKDRNNKCKLLK